MGTMQEQSKIQAQFRYKGVKMQEEGGWVGGVDPDGETPGGSAQRM